MDAKSLKRHAELLEAEIQANLGKSKDVDYLAQSPHLTKLLADAKAERITTPVQDGIGFGLEYWHQESGIQKYEEISNGLVKFGLLLKGRTLPSDLTQ